VTYINRKEDMMRRKNSKTEVRSMETKFKWMCRVFRVERIEETSKEETGKWHSV
jgi:hypothetical protein